MTLSPGSSLSHYRLAERIGEGGMGEVWRATDTTLGRDVAIKVLPAAFASDAERLARFEREAKVLASLNHQNIAAIYGFHEQDGLRFLAMELVPGEDLAHRLTRGPVPLAEALDIARQVAAALEAAHASGIVHRDLKPANVQRTPDGTVKVLDFGLAKAMETTSGDVRQSMTVTSAGTTAGMIVGTAAYMSPEQARAQLVDRRTDLWAFGCLLYEMLCGTKTFDGPTITDVLAAVVTRDPDWTALPAETPIPVRRLLRRCLEKDVKKRLRDAGDASLLLEDNPEDAGTGTGTTVPVPVRASGRWVLPVAAIAVIAALAGGLFFGRRLSHTDPPIYRPLTFGRGFVHSARFAPDGQTVIYGAAFEGRPLTLLSTRTDGFESRPIDVPSADIAGISRDGQLALLLGRHHAQSWLRVGTLAQVALAGGTPRELMENVYDADISPDGKQFAVVLADGDEQVLQYPIGKELFRTHGWISQPRIAPDGSRIAFVDHRLWGDDLGTPSLIGKSGKIVPLAREQQYVQGVCWSPDGKDAWYSVGDDIAGGTLFRVTPGETPRLVLRTPSLIRIQDVAADGHLLILTDDTWVALVGELAGDTSEQIYSWWSNDSTGGIAADGSSYAGWTGSIVVDGEYAVFFRRGKAPPVQLAMGASIGLTPDGKYIVHTSISHPGTDLSLHPVGPGQPRAFDLGGVVAAIKSGQHTSFSSDGRRMAFIGAKPGSGRAAWVLDLAGGVPRAMSPEGATAAILSPDGSKVAAGDATRGMYVAGDPDHVIDLHAPKNDEPLAWSADGCCVFSWDGTLPPRIFSTEINGGRRTFVRELVSSDAAGLTYGWLTLSPDGRFYLQRVRRVFSTVMFVTP